jgi:hypothetical protein
MTSWVSKKWANFELPEFAPGAVFGFDLRAS